MESNKQYEQINGSLNRLSYLLKKLGVSEFKVTENERNIILENKEEIDQDLLNVFCKGLLNMYDNEKLKEPN